MHYEPLNPKALPLKELLAWKDAGIESSPQAKDYSYHLDSSAANTSKASASFDKTLKGAVHGVAKDQFKVAQMYEAGLGIAKNENLALEWYLSAAKQGFSKAKFNLALI